MYRPVRVTPPAVLPVTLAEARQAIKVETDEDDAVIGGLIAAATDHFDGWSGILRRCLVRQIWRQTYDGFTPALRLPMPALSVEHVAVDGDAIDAALYELAHDEGGSLVRPAPGEAWPAALPAPGRVAVDFVAGYGDPVDVPASLRTAILIMVGYLYDNRGGSNQGGPAPIIERLTRPHRLVAI